MFNEVAKNSTITPTMMTTEPIAVGKRRPHLSPIQLKKMNGMTPPMALEAPKNPSFAPSGCPNLSCQEFRTCIPFVMD